MAQENQGKDWQDLTQLTQGRDVVVERVRLVEKDIVIEGRFELPQLARLNADEQVFVMAFVRNHGSIKEMEQTFGISYPTVKARLNRIAEKLQFVENNPAPSQSDILEQLKRGELTAKEAIQALEARK